MKIGMMASSLIKWTIWALKVYDLVSLPFDFWSDSG